MNLAEPRRHVRVESGDKRDAGAAANPGRSDACDGKAEHDGEGDRDERKAYALGHVSHGLDDTLKHVHVFADGDEQRERGANVESASENASPGDCTRKSAARILYLIAHHRSEFEADKAEADDAEGV